MIQITAQMRVLVAIEDTPDLRSGRCGPAGLVSPGRLAKQRLPSEETGTPSESGTLISSWTALGCSLIRHDRRRQNCP